jgi:hypothetical protein
LATAAQQPLLHSLLLEQVAWHAESLEMHTSPLQQSPLPEHVAPACSQVPPLLVPPLPLPLAPPLLPPLIPPLPPLLCPSLPLPPPLPPPVLVVPLHAATEPHRATAERTHASLPRPQ